MEYPLPARLVTQDRARAVEQYVEVIGEIDKDYRIRATKLTKLGGLWLGAGEQALVPKTAIKLWGHS